LYEAMLEMFANIDTFAKAYAIMNNAKLGSDEIYEQLGKIFNI
jgi:hypothetical protein